MTCNPSDYIMWRRILRWLSPLLIAGICFLPAARAANPGDAGSKPPTEHTPALQFVVAFVALLLILLILCKPSRKTYVER
jgi:hypothetical protein